MNELTPREAETAAWMAYGLTNAGIARKMFLTERAVEKHMTSVLWKLTGRLEDDSSFYNRRVLAVLKYLEEAR